MPVPKFRTSASKRNMRRSHHALKNPGVSVCQNCDDLKRPHIVCASCGFYDGKQVMEPKKASTEFNANDFEQEPKA